MSDTPTNPSRPARTFRVICGLLALAAVIQAVATAVAMRGEMSVRESPSKRNETFASIPSRLPSSTPQTPAMETSGSSSTDVIPSAAESPSDRSQSVDTSQGTTAQAVLARAPAVLPPRRDLPAPLDVPITNETILTHLDEGIFLRNQGDMLGSLTHLRAALALAPDHPKLIYQLAVTLDTVGQPKKAKPYWDSLRSLGRGAGDFFILARERLGNGMPVVDEPEDEKEGIFSITNLEETPVKASAGGERVQFNVILKKNHSEPFDMNELFLTIHFFDTINGRRIARSTAAQPVISYTTLPLDWKDGAETMTFEYWQEPLSPDQVVEFGRCKYYGCTLEVYFKDKLQDTAATTPELLQIARELPLPAAEPSESIFEKDDLLPETGLAPQGSLFPPGLR